MWFNLLGLPLLRRFPLVLTVHDPLIHLGDEHSATTPQWIYDALAIERENVSFMLRR